MSREGHTQMNTKMVTRFVSKNSFSIFVAVFLLLSIFGNAQVARAQFVFGDSTYMFSQYTGTGALADLSAKDITQTTATIVGKVTHNTPGFAIYLDLHNTGTFTDHFVPTVASDGTFTYRVTGLIPSFTYHFIAVNAFNGRTALSAMNSFVTLPVQAKIYVSKIDATSATIEATISEGAKNPVIVYGTSAGALGTKVSMTLSNGIYTASLSGLSANTDYFYQLQGDSYVDPSTKVYYSAVSTFTTSQSSPSSQPSTPAVTTPTDVSNPVTYSGKELVQCGTGSPLNPDGTQSCGFKQFLELISRVIDFLLFLIAPVVATILILYRGFMLLTAGGNTEQLGQAKSALFKIVIGLTLALGAWLIVKAILVGMGVDSTIFPVFY